MRTSVTHSTSILITYCTVNLKTDVLMLLLIVEIFSTRKHFATETNLDHPRSFRIHNSQLTILPTTSRFFHKCGLVILLYALSFSFNWDTRWKIISGKSDPHPNHHGIHILSSPEPASQQVNKNSKLNSLFIAFSQRKVDFERPIMFTNP